MGCGQTKEKQDDLDFEKGTMDLEVFKFLQLINNRLDLKKYQYTLNDGQDNLSNFLTVMNSRVGGCVANDYNPLREQIMTFRPQLSQHGRYYCLQNVLKQEDEPNFYDIWIIVESIKNTEHQLMLQSLHDLSEMKLTHWNKEMLYPYENKFLNYNEIAPSLSGYARIIEFRCFQKGTDGKADPTNGDCNKQNWILSMTEGYINKGRPEGYCRVVNAFNGQTKLGYYKEGKPHGKWVCYDLQGREWSPKGIYLGQKRCLQQKNFEDFLINEEPIPGVELTENDKMNILYEQSKEWQINKDRYDVVINRNMPQNNGQFMSNQVNNFGSAARKKLNS